jgi:hypothetical protein
MARESWPPLWRPDRSLHGSAVFPIKHALSLYDPAVFGALDGDRDAEARANLASLHFRWGDSPAARIAAVRA